MPELPEVEVIRRQLVAEVTGRRVQTVVVTGSRSVRREDPDCFVRCLRGMRLGAAGRTGKFLHLPLGDGDEVLVVHLRMSGQLRLCAPEEPPAAHTHVVFVLSDGRELRFVDRRTFGELFTSPTGESGAPPALLAHLGPDALDPAWSPDDLARLTTGRRLPVKNLLTDQRRVAGLGNIYSDEALFASGIRYDRPAGALSRPETERLHAAIRATLVAAIEHRGSSLADATYVDLTGAPGAYQAHHRVYAREGGACPACPRGVVVRRRFGGRSTFFCPTCQR